MLVCARTYLCMWGRQHWLRMAGIEREHEKRYLVRQAQGLGCWGHTGVGLGLMWVGLNHSGQFG